jgi:sec-independent protein translocase protein TatC
LIANPTKSIFARFNKAQQGEETKTEMTFIDHLEDLRWHIVRSLIAWIVAAIVIFIFSDWVFDNIILAPSNNNFVSYGAFCRLGQFLHLGQSLCMPPVQIPLQGNTMSGPFLAAINISLIGGFIVAFPYVFFEFWKFVKPALSDKELKYGRKSIFWVSFCFFIGCAFGYYLLAPFTFNFLANFTIGTTGAYKYMPTLDDYIDTLTNLLLGCGIAFELPILAVVLAKIGLITAKFLKNYRRYAYIVILVLAAVITPSPDWISQMIVALPLFILFEISIMLVKKIDIKKEIAEKSWE